MRHIGRIAQTDQKAVILYMQLPDEPEQTLLVTTTNLPHRLEDQLMSVLEKTEGQSSYNFADILSRTRSTDSGISILEELHRGKYIFKQSIDNVVMLPRPNYPIPLREVLESMGKIPNRDIVNDLTPAEKYNNHSRNNGITKQEERDSVANNLLREASLLEHEAATKRNQAYQISPHLNPNNKRKQVPTEPAAVPVAEQSVNAETPPVVSNTVSTVAGTSDVDSDTGNGNFLTSKPDDYVPPTIKTLEEFANAMVVDEAFLSAQEVFPDVDSSGTDSSDTSASNNG